MCKHTWEGHMNHGQASYGESLMTNLVSLTHWPSPENLNTQTNTFKDNGALSKGTKARRPKNERSSLEAVNSKPALQPRCRSLARRSFHGQGGHHLGQPLRLDAFGQLLGRPCTWKDQTESFQLIPLPALPQTAGTEAQGKNTKKTVASV